MFGPRKRSTLVDAAYSQVRATAPDIELRGIHKRYGGTVALSDVTVQISPGQVHAFVGENGAGKSTLGKILAGSVRPDEGQLFVNGVPVSYASPRDALSDGIARMDQEIMLVPQLSVLDNVLLGVEPTRAGLLQSNAARERFHEYNDISGFQLDHSARVSDLSVADQQKVEMLRALSRDVGLIVMDEPTAPLTPNESDRIYAVVRRLRDEGRTVVYVSHFLEEILDLSDVITIMRDGQVIRSGPTEEESVETLVDGMIGHELGSLYPERPPYRPEAPVVFSADGVSSGPLVHDVSLQVLEGEIVGMFGLVGSGRSEFARTLFGAQPTDAGTMSLAGDLVAPKSPREAIQMGIAMLPEDRKGQGLCLGRSIIENVTLPYTNACTKLGLLSKRHERREVERLMDDLDIRAAGPDIGVSTLSGGNQQKVLFAKWLFRTPRFLIVDEPTRGVDIGAKRAIHQLLADLAARGVGILLISSELEEVLGVSHRVLVMRHGTIVGQFEAKSANEEAVLTAAFAERSKEERDV